MLCAFLVYGCTDVSNDTTSERDGLAIGTIDEPSQPPPLLSLSELLSASDVKLALAAAAANNDEVLLLEWQGILLQASEEVNLKESEKNLLKGEQGLKYLAFQGMKSNYQAAFQRAFMAFEDVDEVFKLYPAFEDLHERSSRLVEQRDALIESVAKELKQQNFEGDAYEEAKRQWQAYIKSQPSFNS